eukprot:TRINITY_DN5968_c0_g1_i1.p1 TRINITY_DN5968_c0_g1~~TRINITY_DN5968_c0_g1_i1.p1  ORF type:complete len:193 (-),score=21.67 TRINITY_DN5968_c0_g1_i1:7-585(-)
MKIKHILLIITLLISIYFYTRPTVRDDPINMSKSFYSLSALNIYQKMVPFSTYQGKVSLVVNVASACGLTQGNYKELEPLYQKYKSRGFEILAFPCNQFGSQEPGTNEEICEFVEKKYKSTFPLFDKVEVNGPNTHSVYKHLKEAFPGDIDWNFAKFLVDRNGNVVKRYSARTLPSEIDKDIPPLLEKRSKL